MTKISKRKNYVACMIRGKAVEEAIRFSFSFHRDRMSVPAAQNYANDLFYLRTQKFPKTIVKKVAKPLNSLVRAGIQAFVYLNIKSLSDINSYKLRKLKYVYPDFKTGNLNLDGDKYKNCCLELKVSSKNIKDGLKKHINQCVNYSTKSRSPVILIYLIFSKNKSRFIEYSSSPKFFIINKKKWQDF